MEIIHRIISMQGNSLNYIPWNKSSKSKLLLKGDIIEALFCDSITSSDDTQVHWRKKRKDIYQALQNFEEWSTNILRDPNLSQSYGNPDYYPEVPQYSPPKEIPYTQKQIQEKILQSLKHDKFIENNIHLVNIPIQSKIMNKRFDAFSEIDSSLLSHTIIHGRNVDIITNYYQTHAFSYPVVVSHVGYLVSILINPLDNRAYLGSVYIFNKSIVLKYLLKFLKDLKVENMKDLQVVQHYLSSLLPK
jgi:hypothetical protein